MKIEIKLKDPKYCDGCPCLFTHDEGEDCGLGFGYLLDYSWNSKENEKYKRPKECIQKHGE